MLKKKFSVVQKFQSIFTKFQFYLLCQYKCKFYQVFFLGQDKLMLKPVDSKLRDFFLATESSFYMSIHYTLTSSP